jgi:hypothetical protein
MKGQGVARIWEFFVVKDICVNVGSKSENCSDTRIAE